MTAPVRTWSNPFAFRVEPSGIAIDYTNNIVYIFPSSSSNTVQKTTDNGATWTALTNAPVSRWYCGFVTSTGRILAFSDSTAMYLSDDHGVTWTGGTGPWSTYWVNCCFQASDGSIYLGCYNMHMYKSTDDGMTWTDTTNNLPTSGVNITWIRQSSTGTIWVADGSQTGSANGNMYYSTDGGATWASSGYSGYPYTQFVLIGNRYYAPIFSTSYVFNGTIGSYTGANIGITQNWWGCFPDNDGRYYMTDYAGHVYSTTNFSSFSLDYTNTGGLFAGIVDAKDNIWIAGGSNIVLGSVPAQATKQLYVYSTSSASWKPVVTAYVGVGSVWKQVTAEYGGVSGVWK